MIPISLIFTNFHQFSPIFANFDGILSIGSTRRFRKYIYVIVGVKSKILFCPFQLGKIEGGGWGVIKCYLGKCRCLDPVETFYFFLQYRYPRQYHDLIVTDLYNTSSWVHKMATWDMACTGTCLGCRYILH